MRTENSYLYRTCLMPVEEVEEDNILSRSFDCEKFKIGEVTFTFETVQRTEDLNLQVDKIEPRKREEYCRAMLDALASKSSMKSDWVKHRLTEGDTVYLDLKNHRHVWSKPRQVRSLTVCLICTLNAINHFCVHTYYLLFGIQKVE